jgi:uncharacterized membrane protein
MWIRAGAAYLAAALVFCSLDLAWLGLFAKGWYQAQLGPLLLPAPRWSAGVAFYAVYLVGLLLFGVLPALRSGLWRDALLWGALYGFFTYYTYDMTNLATLKGWPATLVVVDVAWGTLLNGLVAVAAWQVASRINA